MRLGQRLGSAVAAGLAAVLLGPVAALASSGWQIVPSGNPGPKQNGLAGVAALSAGNIWAVGNTAQATTYQTLVEHYDGLTWTEVPSPSVPNVNSALYSVSAVSASNLWATGSTYANRYSQKTLVEHYDRGAWTIVASPNLNVAKSTLNAVVAVVASDVWAAGYGRGPVYNSPSSPLIEHWDGVAWSITVLPSVSGALYGLTAASASDAWAVGEGGLALHYDGSAWKVVATPHPTGATAWILYSASQLSSSNAWAVGDWYDSGGTIHTLVEHYDGTAWTIVPSPDLGTALSYLFSVKAASARDIWAVGTAYGPGEYVTLTEHYNGTAWQVVPSPNGAGATSSLRGVTMPGPGSAWAVGDTGEVYRDARTLVEHYS